MTDVEKVELSKTDAELGESDITVYLNQNGHRYALLIELSLFIGNLQRVVE